MPDRGRRAGSVNAALQPGPNTRIVNLETPATPCETGLEAQRVCLTLALTQVRQGFQLGVPPWSESHDMKTLIAKCGQGKPLQTQTITQGSHPTQPNPNGDFA